eukprot:2489037-Pleurochrysis_carterae.AAC.1
MRRAIQRCAAAGGGFASSNCACDAWIDFATNVEMARLGLHWGVRATKPWRLSTTTPALPASMNQTNHCTHRSACCTAENLYADSTSVT